MHNGVDTRAVRETGVDHRRRLVDPPADLADDLLDNALEVRLVDELGIRAAQKAGALDPHLVRPVDHYLGDVCLAEERVDRTVTEDVIGDLLKQRETIRPR